MGAGDHSESTLHPPAPSEKAASTHPVDKASRTGSPQLLQLEWAADPVAYLDQAVGLMTITGGVEVAPDGRRRVTVVVRDYGRWRPIPIQHENRRRGIPIMRACMDALTIGHSADQVGPGLCCAAELFYRLKPALPMVVSG